VSRASKIAAGVAVLHKDLVLLAKRVEFWGEEKTPVPLGGYWSIFAGSIEEGESPSVCAVRELKEESQIHAEITDIVYTKTIEEDAVSLAVYVLEVKEIINPILNEEHTEFGWFRIDSLESFPDKIDTKVIDCINHYAKFS
jgi:ADP-ribose pyrophosphatase YjhB (NUDIX family)